MATNRRRSIRNQIVYVSVALLIFFGTIGAAQAVGWWSTSGRIDSDGNAVQPTADPDSVKGWMTVAQVCQAFGIESAAIYEQFAIPPETSPSTELKDLETVAPGFEISSLREWLATLGR